MEQSLNLNIKENRILSKNNFLIFLAGCCGGTSFAPIFFFPGIISVSYLCYKIKQSISFKESFFLGLIYGFGYYLISMYWISIAIHVYIEEFWWAIPIALFGIPLALAFFTAITCGVSSLTKTNNYYPFFFSVIWVFYEWVSSWIFTGLPWALIGYSLSFSTSLIQSANLFGVYGLSFIIMNIVTNLYHIFSKDYKKFTISIIYFLLTILIMLYYGSLRLKQNPTQFSNISARLIQPSIPQLAKWDINHLTDSMSLLESLSAHESINIDLIIWPEAALVLPFEHQFIKPRILRMLEGSNSILLTGSIVETENTNSSQEGSKLYTAMQAISNNGVLFDYYKSHLVPFGEYMPFKKFLPFKKLTAGYEDYTAGDSKLVYLEKLKLWIKPLICYESIFPSLVRTPNNLADILINITNDGWYGNSSGPYQHLQINIMRSVENGLPMLRDANNGISAVIDPVGRIVRDIPLNDIDVIDTLLPMKLKTVTLYSKTGELSLLILVFFFFLMQSIVNFSIKGLIK